MSPRFSPDPATAIVVSAMMLTCVVGLDVVATGHGLSPWALGVISLVCALTVAAIAMHIWQGPNGSPSEARLSASLPAPIHRADPLTSARPDHLSRRTGTRDRGAPPRRP